jgi:photosystem II stability/assembly factor-like uncharacterized protein
MKVKVLFSSIPVIFAIFSLLQPDLFAQSQCSYTWTPQTSGTTSILNSVKAVSPMVAWAGGYNGTVRRTTDGGSAWLDANPNPGIILGNVDNIEAVDELNAWCATAVGPTANMYKTTNGGNTWV